MNILRSEERRALGLYNTITPLYIASQNGHADVVNALISAGAHVDQPSKNGRTLLSVACEMGHTAIVNALIQTGADVNKHTISGQTPLFIASQNGHTQIASALINAGADVDKATNHGITPLFIASSQNYIEIVRALLNAGADINKANNRGETPLHSACRAGLLSIVALLVRCNAHINLLNASGNSLFQYALSRSGNIVKIAQLLIKEGATISINDLNMAHQNGYFVDILLGIITFLQKQPEELPKYQRVMERVLADRVNQCASWLDHGDYITCSLICHLLFPDIDLASLFGESPFYLNATRLFMMTPRSQHFREIGEKTVIALETCAEKTRKNGFTYRSYSIHLDYIRRMSKDSSVLNIVHAERFLSP